MGGGDLSHGGNPHASHSGKRISDWNLTDTGWRKGCPFYDFSLNTSGDTGLRVEVVGSETVPITWMLEPDPAGLQRGHATVCEPYHLCGK